MACSKCGQSYRRTLTFKDVVQRDGDILPTLLYTHCKFKDQFVAAFLKVGIDVKDRNNLDYLAELSKTGGDVNGVVIGPNGQPIKFSVEQVLNTIDVTQPGNDNCTL